MFKLTIHLTLILLSTLSLCTAQNSKNVLCLDFTLNGEKFSRGKELRRVFEGVLSNIDNPPVIVEREKLALIIGKIQEEQNLASDFSNEVISNLRVSQVDYVLLGSFTKIMTSETYDFRFEFVRISGTNISSKTVSSIIRFTEAELASSFNFEQKMVASLSRYSFVGGFGVIGSEEYKDFQKQLDEKDRRIDELTALVIAQNTKADSIRLFKSTIPDFFARLIVRNDSIVVQIKPISTVPFKFAFNTMNDTGLHILGPVELVLERPIFYPKRIEQWVDLRKYTFSQFHDIDTSKPFNLVFILENESIYFQELGNKELRRVFKARYLCDISKKSLTLIPN